MPRNSFLATVIGLALSLCASASAGNWYVNKSATGSNHGTDWINAWTEMNQISWSTVACGDTVWLGGGTYTTALKGTKACTADSPLIFNRVRATDAVPSAAEGWTANLDSLVVLPNITVVGPAAYVTIDGRFAYGIQVLIDGGGGDGIDASNNGNGAPPIDHLTWRNIEIYGPPCVTSGNCTGGVVGVQIAPYCDGANRTHLLFDHLSVHRTGEAFRACGWNQAVVQYCEIYDTSNDGQQHEDIQYANPPYESVTWRYNRIFMSPNDGIFFEGAAGMTNWSFYGNVIFHSGGELIVFKSDSGHYGPVSIYNNVFENDGTFGSYQPGWLDFTGPMAAGSQVMDNVFENITVVGTVPGGDYNAYSASVGQGDDGAHSFTFNPGTAGHSQMFVDEAPSAPRSADFHLTAVGATTFDRGLALASPYDVDPDGNARGSGGHWSVGAYQDCSGGGCTPPVDAGTPDAGAPDSGTPMADAGTPGGGALDGGLPAPDPRSVAGGCGCAGAPASFELLGSLVISLWSLRGIGRKSLQSPP